jgi:Tfp pilus assembly protein PilX
MMSTFRVLRNENGSALTVAVLILLLLTVLGFVAVKSTTTELGLTSDDKIQRTSFYAADAGIEEGRAVLNDLKNGDSANWDRLLSGSQFVWHDGSGNNVNVSSLNQALDAGAGRSVGQANFTLQVRDNNDLDGNNAVDTDNIIILTSTGSFRGTQVTVEAVVRYAGPDDAYAQERYDADSSGSAARESTPVANAKRW